jgi:hypothetical protein
MNGWYEWVFFFVFFVPMGALVAMNLLLRRELPEIAAAWARLPRHRHERLSTPEEGEASNHPEVRQAA